MNAGARFGLRTAAWMLALALVALPVVGVMQGWFAADRWPLRQLRIDGPFEQVSAADVRAAAWPHAKPGFFAVRLDDVSSAIERLPWVASVDVRKRWPDILEVRLRERTAAAVWPGDELVDSNGRLFRAPPISVPHGLPNFAGPRSRVAEMLAFQRAVAPQLAPHDLHVTAVQMSRRGGWTLRLDNGSELVLDAEHAEARLARFLAMKAALGLSESVRIARADLRYANGFAIAWQPVQAPDAGPAAPPIAPAPTVPRAPGVPPIPDLEAPSA